MKFDKSKVYTPFNTEGLKIGSKGYIADSSFDLIERVTEEETTNYHTLVDINENHSFPFRTDDEDDWEFFYLVEEPKEPTKRPCTREELLEMLKKQGLSVLYCKENDNTYTIIRLNDERITIISVLGSSLSYDYRDLCNTFTLLDGTELWIKE